MCNLYDFFIISYQKRTLATFSRSYFTNLIALLLSEKPKTDKQGEYTA